MSNHTCYDAHCDRFPTRRFLTSIEDRDGGGTERLEACNMHARAIITAARRNPAMTYDRMEII